MTHHKAVNYPAAQKIATSLIKQGYKNVTIHDYHWKVQENHKEKYYVIGRK